MRRALVLAAAVVLSGVVVAGCGSDDDDTASATGATSGATTGGSADTTAAAAGQRVEVKAAGFAFDPTTIQLPAGQAVTFVIENGDAVRHNLTVEGTDVDTDVEPEDTAEAPAATLDAGSYTFHCEYHPAQMQGTITVT